MEYDETLICPVCEELIEIDPRIVSTWGTSDGAEPYRIVCPSCETTLAVYETVTRTWVAEIA